MGSCVEVTSPVPKFDLACPFTDFVQVTTIAVSSWVQQLVLPKGQHPRALLPLLIYAFFPLPPLNVSWILERECAI